MLIDTLWTNQKGIDNRNKRCDELKQKEPYFNWDALKVNNIYDKYMPYDKWTKEIQNENIKLISETIESKGIFVCNLNSSNNFKDLTGHELVNIYSNWNYGVSDNASQIIEHYKDLLVDKSKKHVILMTPIFKSKQGESGGWRWHKWGEYIGIQNPHCEYLYDEYDIDMVYVFELYEVK